VQRERQDDETELECALLRHLLQRDFLAARAAVRGQLPSALPYRDAAVPGDEGPSYLEVAIDSLDDRDPLAAYFAIADTSEEEHPLEAAVLTAVGFACEVENEKLVAYAAHREGLLAEEAMRLESEIPMTVSDILSRVDEIAVARYMSMLEESPRDVRSLEALADRLEKLGRGTESAAMARKVIAIDPSRAPAHLLLIDILAQEGDSLLADAACEQACSDCPTSPSIWSLRGELAEQNDQPHQALEWFDRALALDEGHWPSHLGKERVLRESGDRPALLRQLIRMDPYADAACEGDRVADEIDLLKGELRGGESVRRTRRKVAKRRDERANEVARLIRGPESKPKHSNATSPLRLLVVVVGAIILVAIALVLYFR
jgi:tetratricopeptide (TPR) repeat protein